MFGLAWPRSFCTTCWGTSELMSRVPCVAELVPGHPDRLPGLIAKVDRLLPVAQLRAQHGVHVGLGAFIVVGDPREEPGAARGPVLAHVVLLGADRGGGLVAEGDEML